MVDMQDLLKQGNWSNFKQGKEQGNNDLQGEAVGREVELLQGEQDLHLTQIMQLAAHRVEASLHHNDPKMNYIIPHNLGKLKYMLCQIIIQHITA